MPTRATPKASAKQKRPSRPRPGPSAPHERRAHPRQPIRLKVVYKSAQALVTEYTSSVSKGGCQLRAKRRLEVGTRFVFEMHARSAAEPLEVHGQVVRCDPAPEDGWYEIGIAYSPGTRRQPALGKILERIFTDHQHEAARRHPRVPVNLVVRDEQAPARRYLLRDLSRGGAGLRLPSRERAPRGLGPGAHLVLTVRRQQGPPVQLRAEVAWLVEGRAGFTHGSFGVRFGVLGPRQLAALEALTRLERPAALTLRWEGALAPPTALA
jgi:hypothetical protein